jgi:hypothetical protein
VNNDDFSDALRSVGASLRETNKLLNNVRPEPGQQQPVKSLVVEGAL